MKTVTITTTKEVTLGEFDFFCENCQTIHTKSHYAIAQGAMGVALDFTCDCGNVIPLGAD
jgi:hypothetical protein